MWSTEEKRAYHGVQNSILEELYRHAELPESSPEERAKYLAEDIFKCTMVDHEAIMRMTAEQGKPQTLNVLETLFLDTFGNEKEWVQAILQSGGRVQKRLPHFSYAPEWNREARYRLYGPTLILKGEKPPFNERECEVPSRVEAYTIEETWEQHPIVFERFGKNREMIIIRADGQYYCTAIDTRTEDKTLKRTAQKLGLMTGRKESLMYYEKKH